MGIPHFEWTEANAKAISDISLSGYAKAKHALLNRRGFFFAHYTAAETLERIINSKAIYLRNSRLMNDRSEVSHGFETTLSALKDTIGGRQYVAAWVSVYEGIGELLLKLLEASAIAVSRNCYIFSMCEHQVPTNNDGILSMWRAYGNADMRVAVVGKPRKLRSLAHGGVFLTPCLYGNTERVGKEFGAKAKSVLKHRDTLAAIHPELVARLAVGLTVNLAASIKHPAFEEEREWRFVLMTDFPSPEMEGRKEVAVLQGIPQRVYKMPISMPNDLGFDPKTIFLHRIILGPTTEPETVRAGIIALLEKHGYKDAERLVHLSGIPYRQRI